MGNDKSVFLFTTAADFISVNHNATAFLNKNLTRKDYNVFYERIICMGSNFFVKYDEKLERKLYLSAIEKVKDLCNDVLARRERKNKMNFISSGILNLIHWGEDKCFAPIFGKSLQTTSKCNMCGLCVRNCPQDNIYFKDDKIKFKKKCLICMRCIYRCPQKVIKSRFFNFIILKDGYYINNIIEDENDFGEIKTKKTMKMEKHFDSYFKDISK